MPTECPRTHTWSPTEARIGTSRLGWVFQYTILTPVGRQRQSRRLPSDRLGDPATPNPALRSVNEPPEDAAFPGVKPAAASVRAPCSYLPGTDLSLPASRFLIRSRAQRASAESCTPARPPARRRQFRRADSAETFGRLPADYWNPTRRKPASGAVQIGEERSAAGSAAFAGRFGSEVPGRCGRRAAGARPVTPQGSDGVWRSSRHANKRGLDRAGLPSGWRSSSTARSPRGTHAPGRPGPCRQIPPIPFSRSFLHHNPLLPSPKPIPNHPDPP